MEGGHVSYKRGARRNIQQNFYKNMLCDVGTGSRMLEVCVICVGRIGSEGFIDNYIFLKRVKIKRGVNARMMVVG